MQSLSEKGFPTGKPVAAALWQYEGPRVVIGCGARELLELELTAFFASRQCPGTAIRAAMDWALQQARAKRPVVSGFHSPLEQSVLKVLISASSPAIVVMARPVSTAKLPNEWAHALEQGHLAVVSSVVGNQRLTQTIANARNALAAQLAHAIVIAHASPGGALAGMHQQWLESGRHVSTLV